MGKVIMRKTIRGKWIGAEARGRLGALSQPVAVPALKSPKEVGGGRWGFGRNFSIRYTQLILCHFSLTIFLPTFGMGGPDPPVAPPLI